MIANRLGIHARPATLLVKAAANFEAEIFLSKENIRRINGKSIMGVMMLAAEQGATVLVETEGPDEEAAAAAIAGLLASSFEEASSATKSTSCGVFRHHPVLESARLFSTGPSLPPWCVVGWHLTWPTAKRNVS